MKETILLKIGLMMHRGSDLQEEMLLVAHPLLPSNTRPRHHHANYLYSSPHHHALKSSKGPSLFPLRQQALYLY